MPKAELLSSLREAGVELNEAGQALFADNRFTISPVSSVIQVAQVSVASLGYPQGATFDQIIERATGLGLSLCPLELGPHLRLQLIDQPEGSVGQPPSKHRAPPGSITVASAPLAEDDETPKGFYLRRIDGVLWLRGYWSWPGHVSSPEDILAFSLPNNAG